MKTHIDFETYSEAGYYFNGKTWKVPPGSTKKGLSGVGVTVYAKHPSTEILSLAYSIGEEVKLWVPGDVLPQELFNLIAEGSEVWAWNAGFERAIWEDVAVKKLNFPPIRFEQWRCPMAHSRAFSLPASLEKSGKALGASVQKDKTGEKLISLFCVPPRASLKNFPLEAEQFYSYNKTDVLSEIEISKKVPELSAFELEMWRCDQRINERGVQVDIDSINACVSVVESCIELYNDELCKLTDGEVEKASQLQRLKKWSGLDVPSLDSESIDVLLEDPTIKPRVKRALEIRKILNSASVKKLYALRNRNKDGRVYDLFKYHAAHTGRAAGEGVQPQNLPRGAKNFDVENALDVIKNFDFETVSTIFKNPMKAVSNCLRGLFIAAPGKVLVASDYSAIEAVVLAELAGEPWRQEVFRSHGKIYEKSASTITGVSFDEICETKDHPLRQLGKVAELASGYGGWVNAWLQFKADEFLTEEEIKKSILAWRKSSPNIVKLWGGQELEGETYYFGCEGSAIQAVLYPGKTFKVDGCEVYYTVEDNILFCTLPSGRRLTYHSPRVRQSLHRFGSLELVFKSYSRAGEAVESSTYGGKLVENVVQAVARDILAHALVNLEKRGYPVVLHVHDEIVCEIEDRSGILDAVESVMNEMPDWARGWPVKAKGGWVNHRFKK
jgi:DNA polymerase